MIVLDASAALDLVLDTTPQSTSIAAHLLDHVGDVHCPHLIDAEVGQALRRLVLSGLLRPARALLAIQLLSDLRLTRYPHLGMLDRAFELRRNLTIYDALYVALAERLRAPLLTRDRGIARSAARLVEIIHIR